MLGGPIPRLAGASGDDEVKWSSSSSVNRRPWQDDERIHCALFRGQRQSDAFSRVLMRRWRLSMGGRALFGRGADAMGIEFGFAVVAPVRVVGMAFLRVSSNWRWRRRLPPPPFLAFGDLIAESRLGYGLVSPSRCRSDAGVHIGGGRADAPRIAVGRRRRPLKPSGPSRLHAPSADRRGRERCSSLGQLGSVEAFSCASLFGGEMQIRRKLLGRSFILFGIESECSSSFWKL